jgi:predicted MFS family arabinose efflux permease
VPVPRRVEGIAIFGVAGMAPNGLGPALGEVLIARGGYPAFFLTACAFALVSALLTTRLPERTPRDGGTVAAPPGGAARDVVRTVLQGGLLRVMVAAVVFGAGIDVAFYFVAPFTRDLGLPRAAPFFAAYAGTTVVLRVFGRRLLGRAGTHRVVVPAFASFAIGLAVLAFLPAPGVLLLAGVACGAGHGSLFPLLNALAVARTPVRLHGTVVSLYTGAIDLGAVLGTPIGGAVAHLAGYPAMFLLTALACVGALALMASDPHRHRPGEAR